MVEAETGPQRCFFSLRAKQLVLGGGTGEWHGREKCDWLMIFLRGCRNFQKSWKKQSQKMKNEHVDFFGGPYVRDDHHPWTGNFVLKQPRLNRKTLWVLDTVHVFPLCSTAWMTLKRVSKGETSCFLWQSKKRLRMKLCIYIYDYMYVCMHACN